MTTPLTSGQNRKLKALAQKLEATLKVGKNGLSDAFIQMTNEMFAHHELIKVKFVEHKEEREELAGLLAGRTSSHLVTVIGHVAVLYRPHPDPERRKIVP